MRKTLTRHPIMAQLPEPYLARRIAHIDTWLEAGHSIKVYGIHRDPERAGPILSDTIAAAVRAAVQEVLAENAADEHSHGLGFCIVHVGQEAVWLLVDWWISGGIVCQRMLSAPLAQPENFTPVSGPALACVWELVITAHERNAWVRHMLTAEPDARCYLEDLLPAGRY
ncbi:hypothetical protein ACFWP0_02570 [Achromobacter sp. NPDC058515]|uniref:hypothetical protein n=1 Tax=Achromobacter sp. NPDC058515 TaxID=3346533 RepID=UPI0036557218